MHILLKVNTGFPPLAALEPSLVPVSLKVPAGPVSMWGDLLKYLPLHIANPTINDSTALQAGGAC